MGNRTKYKGAGKHVQRTRRRVGRSNRSKHQLLLASDATSGKSNENITDQNQRFNSKTRVNDPQVETTLDEYECNGKPSISPAAESEAIKKDTNNIQNYDTNQQTLQVKETNSQNSIKIHDTNADDSIEKLQIEKVTSHGSEKAELKVTGRRIIHFEHFVSELIKFSTHNKTFGCSLENMICENEQRKGLISKLTFRCSFCKYRQVIQTDSKKECVFDTNMSAVAGIMTIGGGFSALDQFMSSVDVPSMSERYYQKIHSKLAEQCKESAEDSMANAAAEEREAALQEGRVDNNGTPIIDVVADGCWAKRSYRTNYSSSSGAAAIIGKRFGKVLFLAVRNKYCSICKHGERNNATIDHKCYKNYEGSSSGMESDILVEGFKTSIAMYNIIYGRLISDGDSSTYNKILEAQPYSNVTVEKIECINHLLRNFCNKMRMRSVDTRFPVKLRKLITQQRIMSMRRNFKKAIRHYQNVAGSDTFKINNLHSEINNILLHVFHSHLHCKDFYCSESKCSDPEELIDQLRITGLWLRLTVIVSTIAAHARSLLRNSHSNIVESFNSIIAKFIGGKRMNFTSRGSYTARVFAAILAYNTKRPIYEMQKATLNQTPSSNIKKLETRKLRRYVSKNRVKRVRKRLQLPEKNKQNEYGAKSVKPDMSDDAFDKNKKVILENLEKNSNLRFKIQEETILQREDTKWMELRRKMLTASSFGSVILKKPTTSCASLVKKLLCPKNLSGVPSINHGIKHEKTALKQLEQQEKVDIEPCGLFIDQEHPFLGATPDGIIKRKNGKDLIVEIKCPITAYKMGLQESIEKKKVRFWSIMNDELTINKNHPWFYQIQGQLHISQKDTCLFAVWSGEDKPVKTEYIKRDNDFWENKMMQKLVQFYTECMLPEIIDSRLKRGLPVREPDFIKEAIEKKKKQKLQETQKRKIKHRTGNDEIMTNIKKSNDKVQKKRRTRKDENNHSEDNIHSKITQDSPRNLLEVDANETKRKNPKRMTSTEHSFCKMLAKRIKTGNQYEGNKENMNSRNIISQNDERDADINDSSQRTQTNFERFIDFSEF